MIEYIDSEKLTKTKKAIKRSLLIISVKTIIFFSLQPARMIQRYHQPQYY